MDITTLDIIVQGQSERNILSSSMREYLGRCATMTKILNENPALRSMALELDENDEPIRHAGEAKKVFKIKFPMAITTARYLFAQISIDTSLPRKKRGQIIEAELEEEGDELRTNATIDPANPSAHRATVTGQTYQNYKSALKWWHAYDCPRMQKIGFIWPEGMDSALATAIATYKRDIGVKKRGVMQQKEGKSPYNLEGYITINQYLCHIEPTGQRGTWGEGIFASIFTVLSVNTIGRSDNIDDCLLSNIGWENDALSLRFGATKSDQSGSTTSEIKRLFANPFQPDVCVILKLAVYIFCTRRTEAVEAMRLFEGTEQNKRYYNILITALKNIPDHINLGCNRNDIGTHSNRKFAESTSASKIDGPSRTQVFFALLWHYIAL